MYKLKGFVSIESFILNQANVVSPIGEISTYSLTFAKDKGIYSSALAPLLTLYSFTSAIDSVSGVEVPAAISTGVFSLVDWVYQKQIINGAPAAKMVFLNDLVQQFGAVGTSLNCGDMVEVTTGVWLPEWISWKAVVEDTNNPAHDNEIMIWLSDSAFAMQYDEFSITVIPPLANLNMFFDNRTNIVNALAARTMTIAMQDTQLAKEGYPETILSAETYDWINPVNPLDKVATNWTFLIYGAAGDNEDSIREAIRAYIAQNSAHTEAEWKGLFPDIYKNTEFFIFPRWHNYAVAERVLQEGTYSPVVMLRKEIDWLKARLTPEMGYTTSFIENHASVMPCNYKSLALLITGGPDNRNSLFDITRVFSDIINVPTSDTLFEAMTESTQEWLLLLERALIVAERATAYSTLPLGMHRLARAGMLYITARYRNITYLVATKATTPTY